MSRCIGLFFAAVAVLALSAHGADAAGRRHRADPRVAIVGTGVGVASTAGYFALRNWKLNTHGTKNGFTSLGAFAVTTAGCIVAAPMVTTFVVQRPLTYREAHELVVGCVIPIIGPLLVDALYDSHPAWAAYDHP
jgi:hypothetical protein